MLKLNDLFDFTNPVEKKNYLNLIRLGVDGGSIQWIESEQNIPWDEPKFKLIIIPSRENRVQLKINKYSFKKSRENR